MYCSSSSLSRSSSLSFLAVTLRTFWVAPCLGVKFRLGGRSKFWTWLLNSLSVGFGSGLGFITLTLWDFGGLYQVNFVFVMLFAVGVVRKVLRKILDGKGDRWASGHVLLCETVYVISHCKFRVRLPC